MYEMRGVLADTGGIGDAHTVVNSRDPDGSILQTLSEQSFGVGHESLEVCVRTLNSLCSPVARDADFLRCESRGEW